MAKPAVTVAVGPGRVDGPVGRYAALDGLRGLAAVAVFVHHCMIVDPRLDAPVENGAGGGLGHWRDLVAYSPLHLAWAGTEAVLVFFVLSGFVVALPFTGDRRSRPSWPNYYSRRVARLYLPVVAAVAFAAVTAEAVHRRVSRGHSLWLNVHDVRLSAVELLRDAALLGGTDGLNGPLWSLRWEVAFSLLLPLYLVVARRFGRGWPLLVVACFLAVYLGFHGRLGGEPFLPIFMLGVLMAVHRDRLVRLLGRITGAGWAVVTVVGLGLLLADWTPLGWPRSQTVSVLGAIALVLLFLGCPAAQRLGTTKVVAFLGRISFSLYLTHDPIVVSIATLAHTSDPAVLFAVGAPISLAVAYAFQRFVEGPSHDASKAFGRLVDRVTGPRPARQVAAEQLTLFPSVRIEGRPRLRLRRAAPAGTISVGPHRIVLHGTICDGLIVKHAAALRRAIASPVTEIDLSGVLHLDDTALGLLAHLRQLCPDLAFTGATPAVELLLEDAVPLAH